MEEKDIVFKKVVCSSYLKKVNDGKFIQIYKGDIDEAAYCDSNDPNQERMSDCCGDHDFLKTYYMVKEKTFRGFVVGIKEIVVTAYLCADTCYHSYNSNEYLKVYKNPDRRIKCAIVYYQNNRKRYVPLESIENEQKFRLGGNDGGSL